MKLFFVILFLFISVPVTFSATEKSFIPPEEVQEYMKYMDEPEDVQNARENLFYKDIDIPYKIKTSEYQKYFIDKSYNPKTNNTSKLKWISYYSNGWYKWHKNSIWLSFIYQQGKLIYIEKTNYDKKFIIILVIYMIFLENYSTLYIRTYQQNINCKLKNIFLIQIKNI